MNIVQQPVRVDTASDDEQGLLVYAGGRLVAVLVLLQSEAHGSLRGSWCCEAGFGPCDPPAKQVFRTPAEAVAWIRERLAGRLARKSAAGAVLQAQPSITRVAHDGWRLSLAREHLAQAAKLLATVSVSASSYAHRALGVVRVLLGERPGQGSSSASTS